MQHDAGALVLFSGGQDSTVCLAWALQRYSRVETIGFDYGQRHAVELQQRSVILGKLRALPQYGDRVGADTVLPLPELGHLSETALTRDVAITMSEAGLPTTFVPGRNLIFLTYAAALAYRRGIRVLVGGMCETDFSGYPDCRNDTIQATAHALSLGMDTTFDIQTPVMRIDKAGTWALAHDLGGRDLVDLIVEDTHTCYLGDRTHRHDWGYGCATCPACQLRATGWETWQHGKQQSSAGL